MDSIFLVFIVLLWGILNITRHKEAVIALPLFFPFYLIKFPIFGIPLSLIEIFVYISFLPILFQIVKGRKELKVTRHFYDYLPVLLFLVAATVSVFVVPETVTMLDGTVVAAKESALGIWKGWIICPILYFLTFVSVIKEEKEIRNSFKFYVLAAIFLSIWALYQAITGEYITDDGRASGPFESANFLALFIGPAAVYVGIYFWERISQKTSWLFDKISKFFRLKSSLLAEKIISGVVFVVLIAAVVLSQSYGAYLGIFAALIFYSLFTTKKPKTTIKALILILIFFGAIMLTQIETEKFRELFDLTQRTSSAVRIEVWDVATSLIKENPVLGIGPGQFEAQYQLNAPQILGHAPFEWVMLHPHNIFLAFWLNTGFLGLAAFVWLTVLCFTTLRKKLSADYYVMTIISLSLLVGILVHGMVDVPFWKNDLSLLFWLLVGSIFVVRKQSAKES